MSDIPRSGNSSRAGGAERQVLHDHIDLLNIDYPASCVYHFEFTNPGCSPSSSSL